MPDPIPYNPSLPLSSLSAARSDATGTPDKRDPRQYTEVEKVLRKNPKAGRAIANWYFSFSPEEREYLKEQGAFKDKDASNLLSGLNKILYDLGIANDEVDTLVKNFGKMADYYHNRPDGEMTDEEREFRAGLSDKFRFGYPEPQRLAGVLTNPDHKPYNHFVSRGTNAMRGELVESYLGVRDPEDSRYLSESKYKPTISEDGDSKYYDFSPLVQGSINRSIRKTGLPFDKVYEEAKGNRVVGPHKGHRKSLERLKTPSRDPFGQLGKYTVGAGEDEKGRYVSYYDKWDLSPPILDKFGDINEYNNPIEIYGRLYEDEYKRENKGKNTYIDPMRERSTEYGLGGFLKKALPIAAAGASFIPGVGTAAAMGINAGANAISSAIPEEQQKIEQPMAYGAGSLGYEKGGTVKNMKQDGGITEFYGPTHGQGGIDIGGGNEVEHGETMDFIMKKGGVYKGKQPYIFSNRVNVPGKNMSFAKYHKTLAKGGATDEQILDLAMLQEKVTGRFNRPKTGNNMAKGGVVKKYANGGGLDIEGPGYANRSVSEVAGIKKGWWDKPANRSMAYSMLPDAINVATGMFSKDKTPPATKVGRGSLSHLRDMPTTYNINPILTQNAASYRSISADPNANSATKLAGYSQKLQADSQAYGEKINRENQMKTNKARSLASAEGRMDLTQSRYDAQHRDDVMRSDANTGLGGNMARQGLAAISNKLAMRSAEQSLADQDNAQMETLAKLLLNDPDLLQRVMGQIQ